MGSSTFPRTWLVVIGACLSRGIAAAQEQTGSIEGLVRDSQNAVLPGVTVEARNVAVGSVVSVATDGDGRFRFVSVTPGYYDVDATLPGFLVQKYERVEVLLGQIKRLEFTLAVAGMTEQVEVVAASPLVDVKQSSRGFNLREEQLSLLTPGIDFQKAVPLLPGSNNEPKLGGLSIDGSSAAENRFIVDGMNATDVWVGLAAYPVSLDAVEELQVKSSGYTAEYGGATGGVINVITKSGTDAWRGDARLYFSGDALEADPRPTLRRNLQTVRSPSTSPTRRTPTRCSSRPARSAGPSLAAAPGSSPPTSPSCDGRNAP